ncbi:MAG: NTP transferase domain-containing protein [Candidatus Nanopelagicales bacterium]
MQALTLAAGMGRRLGRLTQADTKCMIRIHGARLIDRTLDSLVDAGISRIVLVVGYHGENVKRHVGSAWRGGPVCYVDNDRYATTNNIYSLFLARAELLVADTILLESDLIYDPAIIEEIIANPELNVAAVDKYQSWMDGTVVQVSDEGKILRFIPKRHFNPADIATYYKTVNINKFSQQFLKNSHVPFLEAYCSAMGENEYYEQVLRIVTLLENQDRRAHTLTGQRWYEIDDAQDLSHAETIFAPDSNVYQRYLSRHGGYWRFPEPLDYCYLVNPYFPTVRMSVELQGSLDAVLPAYPSARWVQNLLAGRLFGVDPSMILVGNGAAELIDGLGTALAGQTFGIFTPHFRGVHRSLRRFTAVRCGIPRAAGAAFRGGSSGPRASKRRSNSSKS